MADLFKKGFNKFVEQGNALNKGINKILGKEVFGQMKKIEASREFQPYESFSKFSMPEPAQWESFTGSAI